jgi:endonuclease YncB( thermonuclease family)
MFSPTAIIGKSRVIDGDTVVISGIHIRLEGIDARETDQTRCQWKILVLRA